MNILINGTWQEELPKIKNESVDLIIIDPPYIDGKLHSEHANIFESDGLFFTEDMYEVVE